MGGAYCSLAGDSISVPLLKPSGTALGLLERAKRPWNAPLGLLEQSLRLYLERAKRPWNGPPLGHLEQSLRLYLERALAQMERPLGSWNGSSL